MRAPIVTITALAVLGVGVLIFVFLPTKSVPTPIESVDMPVPSGPVYQILGTSVQGRKIESYTYGQGKTKLVFVGGIHGGYEWNSVFLAYELIDYLKQNPNIVPDSLAITIIPMLNPDGVYTVTGKEGRFAIADVSTDADILASGRFNANKVDLNRNFDCHWQATSTWRNKKVSAGTNPFSEAEAMVFKNFILAEKPTAVVFWHSQSNTIYASQCESGILPETKTLMNTYAKASGYPTADTFDAYTTTGGADDWLASIQIPAFTVELKTHETIEWEKNLAGVKALFNYYNPAVGI